MMSPLVYMCVSVVCCTLYMCDVMHHVVMDNMAHSCVGIVAGNQDYMDG